MATKITDLNGGVAPASLADGDKLVIVDVSDTTQAASGTTKPVTLGAVKAFVQDGGASLFTDLADAATVNLPAVNSLLADDLAAKADAASPVLTGPVTSSGSQIIPDAPMAALVIDVAKMGNSKTVAANSTFSYSATPANNSLFRMVLTTGAGLTHTFPSFTDGNTQASATTIAFPTAATYELFFRVNGSGAVTITGHPAAAKPADSLTTAQVSRLASKVSLKQAIRKAYCRPFWLAHRAELIARNPPVGNTGTVYYIDPTKATNGVGTFADAFNVLPAAATWQGNTVLFAEMTSYTLASAMSNGGNFSFNFGTYSRYDGSRVYDPRRLATINALPAGNIASVMSFTGVGSGSTAIFSGLRLTGSRAAVAATPKGLYCGATAAGSTLVVEHCVIDDVETADAALIGALFDLRCEKMIVRFNRAAGTNVDHFWLNAPSASTHVEFYGNEITTGYNIDRNGPDAVQCNRAAGGAYRHFNGYCNWIEKNDATKQGFFVAGSTPADGAESVWWHRNFMFGIADMTGQTDWAGDGSGHTAMQFDTFGYRVYSNVIDGFRSWGNIFGSTTSRALFAYNLCITENSAFEVTNSDSPMFGTGTSGSDYVIIAHNTFWTINSLAATTDPGQAVVRLAGTNNKANNNIFIGGWLNAWRLYSGTSQPTNYNLYFNVTNPTINNLAAVIAGGGANDLTVDPMLDAFGCPMVGSPVVNAATPITDWDGSLLYMTDPFGRTSTSPRKQNIGAMQAYAA